MILLILQLHTAVNRGPQCIPPKHDTSVCPLPYNIIPTTARLPVLPNGAGC